MSADLSLVVPAHLEAGRLGRTLDEMAGFLSKHDFGRVEVLVVVSDGSDGTTLIARSKASLFENLRVIEPTVLSGKGSIVRHGMLEARGDYRVFMDADLATPLLHLDGILDLLQSGAEVAIGVRNLDRIHKGLRRTVSVSGNRLIRVLLLPTARDTQCGFKGFTAEAAQAIFTRQRILGWGFDIEVLAIARQLRYEVAQLPIPDWEDMLGGAINNASIVRVAFRTLVDFARIKRNFVRGTYRNPVVAAFEDDAGSRRWLSVSAGEAAVSASGAVDEQRLAGDELGVLADNGQPGHDEG